MIGSDRTSVRYQGVRPDDVALRGRLKALAQERRRFGYRRLHVLLRREGHAVNGKRVQREGGGTLHRADTIEALAEMAELPSEDLAAAVAEYNDAVRFNRLMTLLPERSARSGMPRRIETPPFFAIPICAGITNTMGGIAIDGHGRVKRPDGLAIAGLYAAGGATGGLEGGGALGYVGGLIKACLFGLRVAEHAARRRG